MSRQREIAVGLETVRRRIADACRAAGRDPDEVTLVVVTKLFPASDVVILADLGVRHVGENRHQEGAAKRAELTGVDLTWHFVGGLQRNKAAAVARWVDVVQSVDRDRLLEALSRAAQERKRALDVLVQVSLDPAPARGRSGADPADVPALAESVLATPSLRLRGVMGVASRGGDPVTEFGELARVSAQVQSIDPAATWISGGMSGDLEAAITSGATHVRVGTAVLGNRPPAR